MNSNTRKSVLGFNGELLDTELNQYILGNGYRAYNPALQRFTSPDSMSPFGKGGINPYAYCAGDPINQTDPTGHTPGRLVMGIINGIEIIGGILTDDPLLVDAGLEREIGSIPGREAAEAATSSISEPLTPSNESGSMTGVNRRKSYPLQNNMGDTQLWEEIGDIIQDYIYNFDSDHVTVNNRLIDEGTETAKYIISDDSNYLEHENGLPIFHRIELKDTALSELYPDRTGIDVSRIDLRVIEKKLNIKVRDSSGVRVPTLQTISEKSLITTSLGKGNDSVSFLSELKFDHPNLSNRFKDRNIDNLFKDFIFIKH